MTVHHPIQVETSHRPYRFTERDYVLLSENGAFADYAKTELIEGVIYAVNAQYSRHIRVQSRLYRILAIACDDLGNGSSAWIEGSIAISGETTPRPDIFVSYGLPDDGPVPLSSVLLIVEIADSSLDQDLGSKAALYARVGLPEYWVADVNGCVIHQMWSPADGTYGDRRIIPFGERIEAETIAGLTIGTNDL